MAGIAARGEYVGDAHLRGETCVCVVNGVKRGAPRRVPPTGPPPERQLTPARHAAPTHLRQQHRLELALHLADGERAVQPVGAHQHQDLARGGRGMANNIYVTPDRHHDKAPYAACTCIMSNMVEIRPSID
jgi:hypothetical protein